MALRPQFGPVTLAEASILLGALVRIDRAQMMAARSAGRPFPRLYRSGIRYRKEPRGVDKWRTARWILRSRWADCEDLAAYRAAELQQDGINAKAICWKSGRGKVHCAVQLPSGKIEDPSRALGMKASRGNGRPQWETAGAWWGLDSLWGDDIGDRLQSMLGFIPGVSTAKEVICPPCPPEGGWQPSDLYGPRKKKGRLTTPPEERPKARRRGKRRARWPG